MLFDKISRSDLMKRAWQIARREPYRKFAACLSMAWDELKGGRLHNWHHLPVLVRYPAPTKRLEELRHERLMHDMTDTWGVAGLDYSRRLDAEIRLLEGLCA